MMKQESLVKWITVNAFALGFGFLACLQSGMLIEFGFNTEKYWEFIPPEQTFSAYVSALVPCLLLGAIFGSAQAFILRSRLASIAAWIVSTSVGFGLVIVVVWPLLAAGLWGRLEGPVEPIVLLIGGGSIAGLCQYVTLSRQGFNARKWIFFWNAGIVLSIIPTALLFMSLESLGLSVSWPVESFLSGFVVAGVAAAVSGKALFAVLSEPGPDGESERAAVI